MHARVCVCVRVISEGNPDGTKSVKIFRFTERERTRHVKDSCLLSRLWPVASQTFSLWASRKEDVVTFGSQTPEFERFICSSLNLFMPDVYFYFHKNKAHFCFGNQARECVTNLSYLSSFFRPWSYPQVLWTAFGQIITINLGKTRRRVLLGVHFFIHSLALVQNVLTRSADALRRVRTWTLVLVF